MSCCSGSVSSCNTGLCIDDLMLLSLTVFGQEDGGEEETASYSESLVQISSARRVRGEMESMACKFLLRRTVLVQMCLQWTDRLSAFKFWLRCGSKCPQSADIVYGSGGLKVTEIVRESIIIHDPQNKVTPRPCKKLQSIKISGNRVSACRVRLIDGVAFAPSQLLPLDC